MDIFVNFDVRLDIAMMLDVDVVVVNVEVNNNAPENAHTIRGAVVVVNVDVTDNSLEDAHTIWNVVVVVAVNIITIGCLLEDVDEVTDAV